MYKSFALLLGVTITASSLADPPERHDEVSDLRDEVAALRAELATVKRGQDENWLTEQRATQIRGLVADVLADADTRANLQDRMTSAGWDKKFFIQSTDGNFRLEVGGQMQFRFALSRLDDPPVGEDSTRWGFEMRRAKIVFSGHLIDPSWEYAVQGAYERDRTFDSADEFVTSGEFRLQDAYIVKNFDDFYVTFGQFKAPFMKEELLSSKRFQAVDRSLVNERFNQGRTQGVVLGWDSDQWRASVSYNDGPRTANHAALTYDTEWSFSGRVEFLGAGTWRQFRDYNSWSGDEAGFLLGVAAQYSSLEFGTSMPDPKENSLGITADAMVDFGNGLGLFGYFVYRQLDEANLDQWGAVIQGGYFIVPDEWDVFARWEYGDDDGVSTDDLNVITVGFNRYWDQHNLKWTTDFGYGINGVSSLWDSGGASWRADAPNGDGQFVVRSQFQLLF